jgi:hypothetical protein
MGTELYFQVEVATKTRAPHLHWWHFARVRLSQDYLLFALLAGVRVKDFGGLEITCMSPKGLPEDVTELSLEEDAMSVDDEAAALGVLDTCTRFDAEAWVREGLSHFLHDGYAVTRPQFHSHSWVSFEELQEICQRYERVGGRDVGLLQSVLALMNSLRSTGHVSRAVFWFSG